MNLDLAEKACDLLLIAVKILRKDLENLKTLGEYVPYFVGYPCLRTS
jgi:hypothetical protein